MDFVGLNSRRESTAPEGINKLLLSWQLGSSPSPVWIGYSASSKILLCLRSMKWKFCRNFRLVMRENCFELRFRHAKGYPYV